MPEKNEEWAQFNYTGAQKYLRGYAETPEAAKIREVRRRLEELEEKRREKEEETW
jgi:hypothetical protein